MATSSPPPTPNKSITATTENSSSTTIRSMATRDRKERLAQVTTTTAQKIPVYKDKVRPQQQQQQVTTNHSQRPSQPSHYVSSNKKNLQQQQQQQQQEEEGEEVLSPGALAEQEELKRQHEREEEAQKAEDNDIDVAGYKKLAKIGEGTYGEVFRGLCKKTNTCVALKRVQLNISQGGVPTTAIREVALLKEIQHHNVIRLIDLIYFDTTIYLVFDYCDVDLRKYMDEVGREGLTLKHIKSFTHQLLRGLHYCHSHRVLHRDLKPQNLLIDHTGKLTIADLGLSRAFGVPMRTYTHQVITLWYRAPEILLGSPHYSTAVDMWSVGCILAEMITLRPLFPGDSQIDELFRIFRLLGTPTEAMWPGVTALPDYNAIFPPWKPVDIKERLAKEKNPLEVNDLTIDLLKSLLVYDPYNRISAQKAEEHPFFYDDLSMLQF